MKTFEYIKLQKIIFALSKSKNKQSILLEEYLRKLDDEDSIELLNLFYKEECSMEYLMETAYKKTIPFQLSNKLRKQIKNYKSSDNNLNADMKLTTFLFFEKDLQKILIIDRSMFQDIKIDTIKGRVSPIYHNGYCSICGELSKVSMFYAKIRTKKKEISRGSYICTNSFECNKNIAQANRVVNFFNIFS
ncbi:hypothetical protein JEQ21_05975 [Streptococcus sp. 121]|uniref:hypothetical protein n=1 Tax=Streptococcus sp. 121 TaxID=2797637 RepID=UPI0018F0DB3F|nr:hypothetical protein [Streptococcus sp. 121]MBJ6746004.1 hypothetical protein [Streptococcus sp. 121]